MGSIFALRKYIRLDAICEVMYNNRLNKMAERVGFEPTVALQQHTLSRRA